MFVASAVFVYQANLEMINYTQIGKGIFKYHRWDYKVKDYTLLKKYIVYSYIPNSAHSGLHKYTWNGTEPRWMYADNPMDKVYFN